MISKHITFEEATFSATSIRLKIDNSPNSLIQQNMRKVAEECFEPLREWYGKPIRINSFYRSPDLNKAVGGSKTSQHTLGQAIDISAGSNNENKKLFDFCKSNLDFDQLINEYDYLWVHISYKSQGNRKQILIVK
jgi:hypothetical protein